MPLSDMRSNPVGWILAFGMFMVLLYYFSSLSGLSPITNSTIANNLGCNTCGPGGTAAGGFTIIKPFGILFIASFPALIAYGFVQEQKKRKRRLDADVSMGEEMEE